jgi:hypothetical protein
MFQGVSINYRVPMIVYSRLGCTLTSVLVIGPNVREFKPGRVDVFLRAIRSAARFPSGGEVELSVPRYKVLRYVKKSL